MSLTVPFTDDMFPPFADDSELDPDGWMRSPTGNILFWVPVPHRLGLLKPSNKFVIGASYTRVQYDPSLSGLNWTKGWTSF